jgi:hypothetical protein
LDSEAGSGAGIFRGPEQEGYAGRKANNAQEYVHRAQFSVHYRMTIMAYVTIPTSSACQHRFRRVPRASGMMWVDERSFMQR